MLIPDLSHGGDHLLYFEAQGISGYSQREDEVIFYSRSQEDVMQKPSLGFDYLQRLSHQSGDFGAVAIQARVAYDDDNFEFQLYNAYLKLKHKSTDIWLGHNRPALGLSSYFDSHGLVLSTLAMNHFGFDRDWGIGVFRNFLWGDAGISLTTGSGMPLHFKGNYLFSIRVSRGILNQENYNSGFSLSYGKLLDTMGYHLMEDETEPFAITGVDFTYLWNQFENRFEIMAGKNRAQNSFAFFYRFGINLLNEGRLKFEAQPVYLKMGAEHTCEISMGSAFIVSGDVTVRTMYHFDYPGDDHKIIFQLYYYRKV